MRYENMRLFLIAIFLLIGAIFVACKPDQRTNDNKNGTDRLPTMSILTENAPSPNPNAQSAASDSPQWCAALKRPDWWLVFIGLGGVIAALLTLKHMRESSERQMRAYVGVFKCGLKLADPKAPEGQVHIKNFGQTPAYKVRQWIGIRISPHPFPGELSEPPDLDFSESVIWPSGEQISIVKRAPPIPDGVIIGTLQNTVYVYGQIIYEDVFGVKQHTEYRFIYGGPEEVRQRIDANGVPMGYMKADTTGNKAT